MRSQMSRVFLLSTSILMTMTAVADDDLTFMVSENPVMTTSLDANGQEIRLVALVENEAAQGSLDFPRLRTLDQMDLEIQDRADLELNVVTPTSGTAAAGETTRRARYSTHMSLFINNAIGAGLSAAIVVGPNDAFRCRTNTRLWFQWRKCDVQGFTANLDVGFAGARIGLGYGATRSAMGIWDEPEGQLNLAFLSASVQAGFMVTWLQYHSDGAEGAARFFTPNDGLNGWIGIDGRISGFVSLQLGVYHRVFGTEDGVEPGDLLFVLGGGFGGP